MKKTKLLIASFLMLAVLILVPSCSPDTYSLDGATDKSNIHFEITQDLVADPGGNTVIMKNVTPGVVINWDYGTGKSNKATETVKYAFKGDYTIKITAVTDGGLVELDPVTVTVTQDNLNYVNDPLWILLSGGVGHSKTWVLDLDQNGVSKFFVGPMYFYGTDNGWLEGGDKGCYGADCWNWSPDWAGNQWIAAKGDYGTMTFSLDGGPNLTTNHLMMPSYGQESGTYYLDADAKTLSTSNATILHTNEYENCVDNWQSMKVMSLTENTLQLAVLRKASCEAEALLVYNFISKEYSDNWVPPVTVPVLDEGFNPTFAPGELLTMLTGGTGAGRVWNLDGNGNPVDWIKAGKGWTVDASNSYDWGWSDAWLAISNNSWIRFDQWGGKLNYTRSQEGTITTGLFTIDEGKNEISLGTETLILNPDPDSKGAWMSPTTNVIKVIKAFNADYAQKGIWFGTSYDAGKDEWLSFHYIIP